MKLTELAQAIEDGKTIEIDVIDAPVGVAAWSPGNRWRVQINRGTILRYWANCNNSVRIKPALIPVDLSVLGVSEIDCEFWDHEARCWHIAGALCRVASRVVLCGHSTFDYYNASHQESDKCRPRMDHWHYWQGGECPLPVGFVVELQFRDVPPVTTTFYADSTAIRWEHRCSLGSDIIAFKVIGTADTHRMPWEVGS